MGKVVLPAIVASTSKNTNYKVYCGKVERSELYESLYDMRVNAANLVKTITGNLSSAHNGTYVNELLHG